MSRLELTGVHGKCKGISFGKPRACNSYCIVKLSEKDESNLVQFSLPLQPPLSEIDAPMSEASSPRLEPPNSPPSRAGLYLPGILGAPPPPPSKHKQASLNGTKTSNLMTSMDQIIRASSPVETSVSIEHKGGGMMTLSLVFHSFLLELSWNLCNSKLDIEFCVRLLECRNSLACPTLFRSA